MLTSLSSILSFSLISLLVFSISPASAQSSFNISADNTFAFWVDGVPLLSLCPDSQTSVTPTASPSNCAWSQTTVFDLTTVIHSHTVLSLQVHNANGANTNPLTGGTNPSGFLYSLIINSNLCPAFLPFTCIDNLQTQTLYGTSTPPADWVNDAFFDDSHWSFNALSDLGANTVNAWKLFGTPASTLYGGNSIWYNTLGHANTGISSTAHWQWYRPQAANTDLFCRIRIPERVGCPIRHSPRSSREPIPSRSSTPSPFPSASPGVPGECCCDELRAEQGVLFGEARLLKEKVGNITRDLDLLDRLEEDIEILLDLPSLLKAVERLIDRSGGGPDDDDHGHHHGPI